MRQPARQHRSHCTSIGFERADDAVTVGIDVDLLHIEVDVAGGMKGEWLQEVIWE
jgi:hypothetical protein